MVPLLGGLEEAATSVTAGKVTVSGRLRVNTHPFFSQLIVGPRLATFLVPRSSSLLPEDHHQAVFSTCRWPTFRVLGQGAAAGGARSRQHRGPSATASRSKRLQWALRVNLLSSAAAVQPRERLPRRQAAARQRAQRRGLG